MAPSAAQRDGFEKETRDLRWARAEAGDRAARLETLLPRLEGLRVAECALELEGVSKASGVGGGGGDDDGSVV